MDKKIYFEPKEEVVFLQMNSALLAGSVVDPDEPKTDPTPIEDPGLFG